MRARKREVGATLGALPVANLVVLEIGVAIGLVLLAINTALLPVGAGIAGLALILALARWRGRWLTQWIGLTLGYTFRNHTRTAQPVPPEQAVSAADTDAKVTGTEDPRVGLLRLAFPDLVVAHGKDHEDRPIGFAWHEGTWTALLLVDPEPIMVSHVGATPPLPLSALAPCLEDRGVVLDSIQVITHCYPGSAALPPSSPALASYMEVLGPLPAAARRTTWIAVRLDPKRCGAAVRERGGGVVGAHRALIGAVSRVRNALESRGVPIRPLDADELLRSATSAAELSSVVNATTPTTLTERWTGVTAAGIGHASYAVTGWSTKGVAQSLNVLTGIRALSSTVSVAISPSGESGQVGLRGLVRVSARNPAELESADARLQQVSNHIGITLTPLRGQQLDAFAASLPLGGNT
ncbi:type VII secretion protein EccE [Crossiella equi]|nr:type VII secretion protein EccE [Crossiella equi]